jgi:hypothetical protein
MTFEVLQAMQVQRTAIMSIQPQNQALMACHRAYFYASPAGEYTASWCLLRRYQNRSEHGQRLLHRVHIVSPDQHTLGSLSPK